MGLFGGSSKSSTTNNLTQVTTNTQDIDTTTIGLDNVETGVVGDNNSVTRITNTTTTDLGAIDAGRQIAESALDTVGETTEGAFGVARESLGTVERGLDAALDFGSGITADAFAFGSQSLDQSARALESVGSVTSDAFEFATGALNSSREQAAQTAGVLAGAIDRASQATRSDSADTLQKISKFGAVAITVAVLGGVALFIFARRK